MPRKPPTELALAMLNEKNEQIAALTEALAGMVSLHFDDTETFEACSPRTINAAHLLQDSGVLEITKDCSPAWLRANWKESYEPCPKK